MDSLGNLSATHPFDPSLEGFGLSVLKKRKLMLNCRKENEDRGKQFKLPSWRFVCFLRSAEDTLNVWEIVSLTRKWKYLRRPPFV